MPQRGRTPTNSYQHEQAQYHGEELADWLDSDVGKVESYWKSQLYAPLFVYFIREYSGDSVKIGQAKNPRLRCEDLQCGNPHRLYVSQLILARDARTEKVLHNHFASCCVRGEWFGDGMDNAIMEFAREASFEQMAEHHSGRDWEYCATEVLRDCFNLPAGMRLER